MKLTQEQIEAAVAWWMDKLRVPKLDTLGPGRRGDDPAALAEMMAAMAPRPDAECIAAFGVALKAALEQWEGYDPCILAVDYHPGPLLAKAAEEAGLDPSDITLFPWKTCMWLRNDGSVTVRYGYGAPEKTILAGSHS
ncbi:MAG: hypothetical protein DRJ03_29450 [Chloroflexi bacterium]|nr:MAG: hypothetical protein DRJ03_29450 [Chloroflexota bacterium]